MHKAFKSLFLMFNQIIVTLSINWSNLLLKKLIKIVKPGLCAKYQTADNMWRASSG